MNVEQQLAEVGFKLRQRRLGLRPDRSGRWLGGRVRTESQPTEPVTVTVGQLQIIPRDDIDEFKINELSLMPEGLEKQLYVTAMADVLAFLNSIRT